MNDNDLTHNERERRLIQANNAYMAGEISHEEFEEAHEKYGTDYKAIAEALVRLHRQQRPWWKRWMP